MTTVSKVEERGTTGSGSKGKLESEVEGTWGGGGSTPRPIKEREESKERGRGSSSVRRSFKVLIYSYTLPRKERGAGRRKMRDGEKRPPRV